MGIEIVAEKFREISRPSYVIGIESIPAKMAGLCVYSRVILARFLVHNAVRFSCYKILAGRWSGLVGLGGFVLRVAGGGLVGVGVELAGRLGVGTARITVLASVVDFVFHAGETLLELHDAFAQGASDFGQTSAEDQQAQRQDDDDFPVTKIQECQCRCHVRACHAGTESVNSGRVRALCHCSEWGGETPMNIG